MEDFKKLFDLLNKLRVGVIGDIMLDSYLWGSVERISPEAPVPIVTLSKKDYRIGGAGNVALNVRSLGAEVSVFSVTGRDEDGERLVKLLKENKIGTDYIVTSTSRITTNKTRIISRNQQMMRLDSEVTHDLDDRDSESLLKSIKKFIETEKPQVMIFEDYNKGVLSDKVIRQAIELCRKSNVITTVDPKRKNFFSYAEADIFKPNLKEVKEALNMIFDELSPQLLHRMHGEMKSMLRHSISFITLSEKGVYFEHEGGSGTIGSHIRNVADVSGAGDTVIAVASLVYAATKNVRLMAEVANIAGGLVCEEVGTVAINRERLLRECEVLLG